MSMTVVDKGKFRFANDKENQKLRTINASLPKLQKKNGISKHPQISNIHLSSSTSKNIPNKKPTFLNTYQNAKNVERIRFNLKKKLPLDNLKYNSSVGELLVSDLTRGKNFALGNDDIFTLPRGKNYNQYSKLYNNSVILTDKTYKSKNKKNFNNKSINKTINPHINSSRNVDSNLIKKLDDRFKLLENNIIDQKYANDINHDEIIITTQKNNNGKPINIVLNKNTNLNSLIEAENNNDNYEKDSNFEENYLINSSFENNKSDFLLMYTDDYTRYIDDGTLSLELSMLIEKILELQNSYQKDIKKIILQYKNNKKTYNYLIEQIKYFNKKKHILEKIIENKEISSNNYNFISIHQNKYYHDITNSNNKGFELWDSILKNQKNNNKTKLIGLFKSIVFEKFFKIMGRLDYIEVKIIESLMKKYKYNVNIDKNKINNENNYKKNISYNPVKYKPISNKISANTSVRQTKNINKKDFNLNKNKKHHHKKTSSCSHPNPIKFSDFKFAKPK